jgi:hypothetical protein
LGSVRHPPEFSLVLGGPLFQLLRRAHLSDDALMMVRQRLIVIALLTWLPLLLLSALEGQLWGGSNRCRSCSISKFTSASWWCCPC